MFSLGSRPQKALQKLLGLCLTLVAKTAARGTKSFFRVRKRLFFRLSVAVATTQKDLDCLERNSFTSAHFKDILSSDLRGPKEASCKDTALIFVSMTMPCR